MQNIYWDLLKKIEKKAKIEESKHFFNQIRIDSKNLL